MRTKEELIETIENGEVHEYLFFWDEPKKEGVIDMSCLNQWYASAFDKWYNFGEFTDKMNFLTAEHYMMYKKAELFSDMDTASAILSTKSPRKVQKLGREVKNYDEVAWQEISYNVVVDGNMQKFTTHPNLAEYLLATGDKVLVEASPVDAIWGIGLDKHDSRAVNPKAWLGQNRLGFALMEVREKLKKDRA